MDSAGNRPPTVEASVIYLGKMDHRPAYYFGGDEKDDAVAEEVTVPIHDIRPEQARLSYDRQGFQIFPHVSRVADFRDAEQIRTIYIPELAEFVREVTGAAKVVVQRGGAVRLAPRAEDFGAAGTTYPAPRVHSDYSENSAPPIARGMLDPAEAEKWLAGRYAVFSLWRALSPPPQDVPLCLVDATTVAHEDRVLTDVYFGAGEKRSKIEGSNFVHNPAHRWCYFRDMHRDELLFIKAFDSDDSKSWRVPHTSFTDPSAPADAPPRMSMDIRAAVFWGD